jgi:hypothetical protein
MPPWNFFSEVFCTIPHVPSARPLDQRFTKLTTPLTNSPNICSIMQKGLIFDPRFHKGHHMKKFIICSLTIWLSVIHGAGQSTLKPTKINEKELSLASVMISPFEADEVPLSKDLKRDVAAYIASLPEAERLLITASIVFEGSRAGPPNKDESIKNLRGSPKGMILMWMAEYHGARLIFDGSKITFHFHGTPLREDRRWYAISPELVEAFVEVPSGGNADPIKVQDVTDAIAKDTAGMFRGIKVLMGNDTGTKIQLSGPIPTLDALERWMSIKFLKMAAEDHNRRRMPGPVGFK